MTRSPEVIEARESSAEAWSRMETLGIRHLPVMDQDRLVGVLTDRDLRGVRAYLDHAPGEVGPSVGDLCSRDMLVVSPDDPLHEAGERMAESRVGAALVTEGTELVGIITWIDLCHGLTRLVAALRAATGESER